MSRRVQLGEVCYVYDGPHATPTKIDEGPIYLGIDAISPDGYLLPEEFNHLSEEDYVTWTKRVTPQENDIVFSYEATLGRCAIIPSGFYGCLGRRLAIIRAKSEEINIKWLFYYLRSPEWNSYIKTKIIYGSTVNRISIEEFPTYEITLPTREEQDRIVEVLSVIDDKVENDKNILSDLDSITKDIYEYWFIQNEFPDRLKKPYKSNGGKVIWDEKLQHFKPDDWETVNLLDVVTWNGGSQPPKSDFVYSYKKGYVRFIQNRDYSSNEHITYIPISKNNKLCNRYDIMIDKYGDAGRIRYGLEGAYNVALSRIGVIEDFYQEYIRCYLNSDAIYTYLHTSCMASTRASLNEDNFKFLYIAIPPKDLLESFEQVIKPFINQALHLQDEITDLVQFKEWLLANMMQNDGHVTISNVI